MRNAKKIVLISLLLASPAFAYDLTGISFFNPRSQSTDAARDIAGIHPYIHKYNQSFYGVAFATPQLGQLLRPDRINQLLFDKDVLRVSGSLVPDRGPNDLLADYFGLSPAFESTVFLKPFLRTALVDFGTFIGWHNFYFWAHAPVVWTRSKLGIDEIVEHIGTFVPFPPLYMAQTAITAPAQSFAQAVAGGVTFGQVHQGIKYGKFGCSRQAVGLSDIEMALGWDIVSNFQGHAGFNIRASIPTGTRPKSEYLFEPIVGNGKHWELGFGFTGHVLLWEMDGEQQFSFFGDVNVMHFFNARQRRSFDIVTNGFGSRYMLVKQFDANQNYTGNSLPAINVTTLNINVRNAIQIDMALMFGYTYNAFTFDIGYNMWFRSHDEITPLECLPQNRYGFKGIQNVVNIIGTPLDTTQSTATLHGNNLSQRAAVVDPNSPQFFNMNDLDLTSASSPRVLTHKFFSYIGGSWPDSCRNILPFFGIGGEIEVEGLNLRDQKRFSKDTLSQWAVWLKGGFGF